MRIAIVTDAWFPQINGVVRTLAAVSGELVKRGHVVKIFSPAPNGWTSLKPTVVTVVTVW